MIEHAVGTDGKLEVVTPFRPLIFTSVYGGDAYFECLTLFLESLCSFGRYCKDIAIFSDRSEAETASFVPECVRQNVRILPACAEPSLQRYDVSAIPDDYSPILYLDVDVMVDNDLGPILSAIFLDNRICVTTERDTYGHLFYDKISEIRDDQRIGNWWGLEILRLDPMCSDEFLPLVNSGVLGFSDRQAFAKIGGLVRDLSKHGSHQDVARYFGDQPFLNYALVRARMGSYGLLADACSFLASGKDADLVRRGLAHFIWSRGNDKPRQMAAYLNRLQQERHEITKGATQANRRALLVSSGPQELSGTSALLTRWSATPE